MKRRSWLALSSMAGLLHLTSLVQADSLASQGWKERSFSGKSLYSIEQRDGVNAVRGETRGKASALYRRIRVDLGKTPWISWRWLAENTFDMPDEKSKQGDDYPARVYVVYRDGPFPWNAMAINYVWSSTYESGSHWENAYTDKSHVIVLQSGNERLGEWITEKRNIRQDFKTYLGVDVSKIDGYAVMVDGDNTGSRGTAWFTDFQFTAE